MKTRITWLAGIAGLTTTLTTPGATVTVDWLKLPGAGSASAFQLVDDGSSVLGGGRLIVAQGMSFPGLPTQRTLNAAFWSGPTGFIDSVTGLADVSTLDFRVVPVNGLASYTVEFSVPAGRPLLLVVGDLYRNVSASTAGVSIVALSDSGAVPVTLAGMYGWNNGATALTQNLAWDQPTGALATTPGSNGDSKLAFLEIAPITGANPRLVLSVPQGYASGTGDLVTIGLGAVVPEPGILTLAGVCGILGLCLRRRV